MAQGMKALLPLLFLAGCATVPAAEDESYHAVGTEPFWSITIANGRMTYETPEGGFSVRAPRGEELGDGRIWETRRITLQASNQDCSDGMSDNHYPQTVRAMVDGRTLTGCGGGATGGEAATAEPADGTAWRIVSINDEIIGNNDAYEIRFEGGRIAARAGCNRMAGPYTRGADGRLTFGPIMSTRMACPPPRMAHEQAAARVLAAPVSVEEDADSLILRGPGGTLTLVRIGAH